MVAICVESGVAAHVDDATVAWVHDPRWWGLCGQGHDEASALDDLHGMAWRSYEAFLARHGAQGPSLPAGQVVERIHGDEQAFDRDVDDPTDVEVARTRELLVWARQDLLELVASATEEELDRVDPDRELPAWASWHSLRDMAWHITDTESRYYVAQLGIGPPARAPELVDDLMASHRHVLDALPRLARSGVVRTEGGEVWTARKVLRRLAWHERSELDAMRDLLLRVRARPAGS
jgi:hypothetical protein